MEDLRNANLANLPVPMMFVIFDNFQMSHNYDNEQTISISIKRKDDDKIYYKDYYANDMNNSESFRPNYPNSILQNVDYRYLIGFLYFNKEKAIVETEEDSIEVIFYEYISGKIIENTKLSIKDSGDREMDIFLGRLNNLTIKDSDYGNINEKINENIYYYAEYFSNNSYFSERIVSQTPWVCYILGIIRDFYNNLPKSGKDLLKEEFLNYCGVYFYKENKFEDAKFCFLIALELNPYSLLVINNLASTLFKLGQFEEALKFFYDIIKLNPTHRLAIDNFNLISKFHYKKNKNIYNYINEITKNQDIIDEIRIVITIDKKRKLKK